MSLSSVLINAGGVVLVVVALIIAIDGRSPDSSPSPDPSSAPTLASAPASKKERPKPPPIPASADDESAVMALVTRFKTQSDPVDCTVVYTRRLIDRFFDGSGDRALTRCRKDAREHSIQDADAAVIESVSINGRRATVVAGTTGGLFDGRVDTLQLVRVGGRWKIDAITKVQMDPERWEQANYGIAIERGFTPSEASCIAGGLRRVAPVDKIERAIVTGDGNGDDQKSEKLFRACMERATLEREFLKDMRKEAVERGVPKEFMECAGRRLIEGMSEAELRGFLFKGERPSDAEMQQIFASCADPGSGT